VYSGKYLPGSINVNQLVAETGPSDIYMKEDGYNLFLIGTTGDKVYDFALSRQYDITTATLNKIGPTISALEGSPSGLTFKPDGTIMYICGTTGHRIIQYNMSEAWNVNSATAGLTFNVANALSVTNPQAVQLSSNGKYMYFVDSGTDIIYQLSLTQAWNVNTASYLTQKYLGSFDGAFTGIYFSSNGSSMFLGGQGNDRIKEFRLSTSWNVNTATIYANSGSFNSFSDAMSGIAFANNGSMVYLTDTTYDLIHQLPMTQAWNVNTAFNGTSTTGNVMVGLVI
jgi:sugar lactone lactonase YvrE